MNRAQLREAFQARGFENLPESLCNQYINDAYLQDICEAFDWSFLEATKEGAAPLEISDLRTVEYVVDKTQELKLDAVDRGVLVAQHDVELARAGAPWAYYLTEGKKINAFPKATDTLYVRYWKTPEELSEDSKEPLHPKRFHSIVVDFAVARASEKRDNWEGANIAAGKAASRLQVMADSLGVQNRDGATEQIIVTDVVA